MKNIHVLPTDKPSKLVLNNQKELWFNPDFSCKSGLAHPQNIYITSDENIKEGDWFYYKHFGEDIIDKTNKNTDLVNLNNPDKYFRKIILTDDPDLIVNGVQSIDDEFLEWFVKNPSCELVEVIHKFDEDWSEESGAFEIDYYKIIIPQEEKLSYTEAAKKEERIFNSTITKQETLEEYIKEVTKNFKDEMSIKFTSGGIKLGAKWQAEKDKKIIDSLNKTLNKVGQKNINNLFKNSAERMYSAEDMRKAFEAGELSKEDDINGDGETLFDEWFEQFKKK